MGNDFGFTEDDLSMIDLSLLDLLSDYSGDTKKTQVYNKVLLIRREDTFLVNTIKNNLDKNAFQYVESGLGVPELMSKKDVAELLILYVDNTGDDIREALACIKDLILDEGKELIILGDRNEVNSVEHVIPQNLIADIFERPFDMQRIMRRVGDFLIQQKAAPRKKLILIVDDDPTYLRMIYNWLRDDYSVCMASSGMQAMSWLTENKADLVLLDYEMPKLKGSQVLEMMRSDPKTAQTPVIFLTGNSDKKSIMEVLAMKPAGYLLKSIDRANLLENLRKFFIEQRYKK